MKASVQTKEVREGILDATDMLLARYGYRKMTIDDIAAEVGIGKGSIYLHFKSKEDIALSHVDRIVKRLCGRLLKIAESSESPSKKLHRMTIERVSYRFESVQHYSESINELLSSIRAKLLALRKQHHEDEAGLFERVIREGQGLNEFVDIDPKEASIVFITATNALLPFGLSSEELKQRSEIEKKAASIAKFLLKGISSK